MPRPNSKGKMTVDPFRMFLYLTLIGFITLMLVGFVMLKGDAYQDVDRSMPEFEDKHYSDKEAVRELVTEPLILWWTGFTGEPGKYRKCGSNRCFFTVDRHYLNNPQTKALLFYGSDIKFKDMPLPRKPHHEWGILHEESPKNNYALTVPAFIELFNHTATFKRESDFPLTLQSLPSLDWLQSMKHVVSTKQKNEYQPELASLIYVQSDCDVPSGRDSYVTLLMKWMTVDSYGSCVHNKELPTHLQDPIEGMEHNDFYTIQAKYKFSLAMENAICDDYVTEKLWRPLMLGSVPVVYGSPKIRDLLPDSHSAILIEDFESPKALADHLKFLNENDEEYEKYLEWKKTGIKNQNLIRLMKERSWAIQETWLTGETNFVEDFECFVCDRLHKNLNLKKRGDTALTYQADASHLACPGPREFGSTGERADDQSSWTYSYKFAFHEAEAFKYFVEKNLRVTVGDFHAKVSEIEYNNRKGWFQ